MRFFPTLTVVFSSVASGQVIKDFNVQKKNPSPVIGRGYSTTTGQFYSSCIDVTTALDSTADWDIFFTEYTGYWDVQTALEGKIRDTISYGLVRQRIEEKVPAVGASHNGHWNSQALHVFVATMAVDRYFENIENDGDAGFKDEIFDLLEWGNYVEFFVTCGPSYIEAVRKSSEFSSIFYYYSGQRVASPTFAYGMKKRLLGSQEDEETRKNYAFDAGMLVENVAYGLDMDSADGYFYNYGDFDNYMGAMESAFDQFKNPRAGMAREMVIVPFTTHDDFELLSRTGMAVDILALDTEGYQRYGKDDVEDPSCKAEIKAKCDETTGGDILTPVTLDCNAQNTDCTCTPDDGDCSAITTVGGARSVEYRKYNIMQNSEFVLQIDSLLRDELQVVHNIRQCFNKLLGMDGETTLINKRDLTQMTTQVKDVRMRLGLGKVCADASCDITADSDWSNPINWVVYKYQQQVKRYTTNFVTPCIGKLSGDAQGIWGGNLQLAHWTEFTECNKPICSLPGSYWPTGGTATDCVRKTASMFALMNTIDQYCMPMS
mmetsp:Transcript_29491/g.67845  ORF Transcript_29491/g.67845 Transcript_29491/m.67845 type:complete len:546 (-) Transcript_29491:160-1797(-)